MNIKQARGQLRQIAKELLPEVMAGEIVRVILEDNAKRMDALTAEVRNKLEEMDRRQKDVANMILREMSKNVSVPEPKDGQ